MQAKREHSSDSDQFVSDVDVKPNINDTPAKSKKTKSNTNTPTKSIEKKPKVPLNTSGKKMGSWSGEELKLLYSIMCPKKTGINWNEVASQIEGRDAKSCNNKWTRTQSKILQAIEDLGE
ncbi:hypothetical protein L486_02359 [Kwoniella mangroviensis CBS 10435]|uniref:Myb-like domain-containing protein n=1 Tax=Kwoniella mangroviensis CBS 10435 TaxID=1331196 RepID=A0A1B9IVY4_9TREE|nr:hypothetical protein L486_02359 [Kwoniella mangroviensis CBS 10435]